MSNFSFQQISQYDHEQLVFCQDQNTGLKAIIGIHNTTLGPGLGGTRFYNYANDDDAIKDVLRLSRGMTYKAAISGLNLGGAKAVIIGDPQKLGGEAFFRKFGQFIRNLNGKYITAEDVGTTTKDMEYIKMETDSVVGLPEIRGGGGDPSPVTAYGTYLGMKAAAKKTYGTDNLSGKKVLVEGVGKVGTYLVELLSKENATIYASDVHQESLKNVANQYGAKVVEIDDKFKLDLDVYAPCALGATLNDDSIPKLKCKIVAGAANNQLEDEVTHGNALKQAGILYAPDYLINAGGLINVYTEYTGYNKEIAMANAEKIYDVTTAIFDKATEENITTAMAANKMAEERIQKIGHTKLTY